MENASINVLPNDIVDVRLSRHDLFNISETTRASNFKIYHNVALVVFTFRLEMTLSSTSSRQQIT